VAEGITETRSAPPERQTVAHNRLRAGLNTYQYLKASGRDGPCASASQKLRMSAAAALSAWLLEIANSDRGMTRQAFLSHRECASLR